MTFVQSVRYLTLILLLISCSAAVAPPVQSPEPSASVQSSPQPQATIADAPTSVPTAAATAALPAEGQSITWEGIRFAVPPDGEWQTVDAATIEAPAPVQAAGQIIYPTSVSPVEQPFGPRLTILTFAESLEMWMQRVQQDRNSPIEAKSLRQITLANRPAVAYRPLAALADAEYYALKLDNQRLLLIMTESASNPVYKQVIDAITIIEPPHTSP